MNSNNFWLGFGSVYSGIIGIIGIKGTDGKTER